MSAAFVALTAILLILRSEPNARYLYPALPLLCVPFAALSGLGAGASARPGARADRIHHRVRRAQRLLPPRVQLVPQGFLRPVHQQPARSLPGRDRAHPQVASRGSTPTIPSATVLLTQDSYLAGLTGEVYENHWHQYNTRDQIRRAGGMDDAPPTIDAMEGRIPDRAQARRRRITRDRPR